MRDLCQYLAAGLLDQGHSGTYRFGLGEFVPVYQQQKKDTSIERISAAPLYVEKVMRSSLHTTTFDVLCSYPSKASSTETSRGRRY
ncbi:hypothetical protein R1flu_023689 [Riccia fluitans]|uniref:Uncharacterized protein n=1 Tax=Riccia fluitans TaxID=41844 RepID=A0ABD1XSX1_9MARC